MTEGKMSVSPDVQARAIFRSRRMYQTDFASQLAIAIDNGCAEEFVENFIEGFTEGFVKGVDEAHKMVARNMLLEGLPVPTVARFTELCEAEIAALQDQLGDEARAVRTASD